MNGGMEGLDFTQDRRIVAEQQPGGAYLEPAERDGIPAADGGARPAAVGATHKP